MVLICHSTILEFISEHILTILLNRFETNNMYVHTCMYVRTYVCIMCICMYTHVCTHVYILDLCIALISHNTILELITEHIFTILLSMYVCICVCMYVHTCMYVCMYVCAYVCTHMYVRMYTNLIYA